jgi:hypothetical protein
MGIFNFIHRRPNRDLSDFDLADILNESRCKAIWLLCSGNCVEPKTWLTSSFGSGGENQFFLLADVCI